MNADQIILSFALVFDLVLGFTLYSTNRHRGANQQFLVFSLGIGAWLFSVLCAFRSQDPAMASFWIQTASVSGAFLPVAFTLLRLTIMDPGAPLADLLHRARYSIAFFFAIALLCYSPFYITGALINDNRIPDALYGPGAWIFNLYLVGAFIWVGYEFYRDLKSAVAVQKWELQFILLGLGALIAVGVLCAVLLPLIAGHSQSMRLAPLWVILMDSIIAYGIATRQIMDVGSVVRRTISYGLLLVYLIVIYLASEAATRHGLEALRLNAPFFPHFVATILVALTVSGGRVQGLLQLFVQRLFINFQEINLREVLQKADRDLAAVTTTDELLKRFQSMIARASGTDVVHIQLFEPFHLYFSLGNGRPDGVKANGNGHSNGFGSQPLPRTGALRDLLTQKPEPFLATLIHRLQPDPLLSAAAAEVRSVGGVLAIGIPSNDGPAGVVVLGERLSGKIYSQLEQDALQILVNRLASALENANLYTTVQNAKVYNEILLDSLVSGVIAVDQEGKITVFNREAGRILEVAPEDFIGRNLGCLPDGITKLIRSTLEIGMLPAEQEVDLNPRSGQRRSIRVGGSVFRDREQRVLGALMVLHDVSEIKELVSHVHRSDRLATLGKLSATMAHEIKNPLVAIKTFIQLMAERRNDTEFLQSFSKIVNSEVDRISHTVSQLLGYSRTGNKGFQTLHLHEVIGNATLLLKPQMDKKRIQLLVDLAAVEDRMHGDAGQIQQILVNLLLNACEAIRYDGSIRISTQVLSTTTKRAEGTIQTESDEIELLIEDTGSGIAPENLKRVFDPFFTTKESGTGLGLSLTASLVSSHRGVIDVRSEVGKGTTFRIQFPLLRS
jgi:PAS domain S-box-containing protein